MTIFERFWGWLVDLVEDLWDKDGPALTAWLKQFATDEGKIILTDAAIYGPQVYAGTMTMADAFAALVKDLEAKGLQDFEALKEIIFNAIRTQANAAATAVTP